MKDLAWPVVVAGSGSPHYSRRHIRHNVLEMELIIVKIFDIRYNYMVSILLYHQDIVASFQ